MLRTLEMPMTKAGADISLTKEIEKSAYVLYRKTADGLIYAGLYDPDIPDEDYLDGIYKIPLRSTFVGKELIDQNKVLYNIHGSTDDNIFVKGGTSERVYSWVGIWQRVLREMGITDTERKCYVRKESEPPDPCNGKTEDIVGGHLTVNADGNVGIREEVYLLPICKRHNSSRNESAMRPTSTVNAIVMQYKYNVIPNNEMLISLPMSRIAEQTGIDISVHNGRVDFQKVKSAGIDFVMIREGYGNDKAYKYQVDELFETNYIGAKNAGLNVGAYHYLYATTVEGARQEAEGFVDNLKGKQFEMPIALDIEDKCQSNLPTSVICEMVKAFMDICEGAGYYCVLYSYESFLTTKITSELLSRYDVWCANVSSLPHIKSYGMHQYSFTGRIAGVNTNVDLDHAYKDYPALIKSKHFNGF
ncbi:MAG: glycoside hydrolase family 25 protein [Oscillospiraceae bacterium]|nr:glycoside hydrolase family 25 protein [Oscillospiraceae bacterium]